MPDPLTQQLRPASFDDFSFLCPEESISVAGRKIVKHDYPNSNKRFAQDLGGLPPDYECEAVIKSSKGTNDFLQRAKNFEQILNRKGPRKLVLPHQGVLTVTALPYGKSYSQKSVGVVIFKLKFTISNANEIPSLAPASKEDVYELGDQARQNMQNKFEEVYEVPKDRKNVFTAANDYRKAVVNTVRDYTAKTIILNSNIQKIVRDIESDLTTLIRNPIQLAEKLIFGNIALANGLFASFSSLFAETISLPGEVVVGVSGAIAGDDTGPLKKPSASDVLVLANFGDDFKDNGTDQSVSGFPLWPNDTGSRVQRNKNRVLMIEGVRINSLILGFEVATNFDYGTTGEISTVVDILETVYNDLLLSDDDNKIYGNDNEFKILIDEMKSLCYEVLDQKAQQVYSTGDFIARGRQGIMGLAYKLYAERFQTPENLEVVAERLVQLNPSQNPTEFSGDIKIFEVA